MSARTASSGARPAPGDTVSVLAGTYHEHNTTFDPSQDNITVTGPLNPAGATLTPAQFAGLHAALGGARTLPPAPPAGLKIPAIGYQIYRARRR